VPSPVREHERAQRGAAHVVVGRDDRARGAAGSATLATAMATFAARAAAGVPAGTARTWYVPAASVR
jgi:hypothetical protein